MGRDKWKRKISKNCVQLFTIISIFEERKKMTDY